MHGTELVVELRQHDAAGRALIPQPPTDERHRRAWVGQLPPHDHHETEAEQEEEQPGHGVLDADDLVVHGEDVGSQEPRVLVTVFSCPLAVGRVLGCRPVSQLVTPF